MAAPSIPGVTPLTVPPVFTGEPAGLGRPLIPGELVRPIIPGELTRPLIPGELTRPPIPGAGRAEPPIEPLVPPIQEVALPPRPKPPQTPPGRPITSPVPTAMPFILPTGSTIIPTIPLSPPVITPGAERALAKPFTIQQVVARSKVADIMVKDKKTDTEELLRIEKISGKRGKRGQYYRLDQLQDIATQLGLKHTGKKDELANRILSYLRHQGH